MWSIRKVNPMVRAVGTMGAIAAVAGGITFAALTSNTVALTPNTLATASAALVIDAGSSCSTSSGTSTTGLSGSLTPGGAPVTTSFCIENTGNVPLAITGVIPQDLSGSTAAAYTTLDISCTNIGSASAALTTWDSTQAFTSDLDAGAIADCTASASLSNSYGGSGGESIPAFSVNFTGTEPSTTNT